MYNRASGLVLLIFLMCAAAGAQENPTPIAILNTNVVDTGGGPTRAGMHVIISGKRIVQVGKATEVQVPEGARRVDGRGRFLIPGLWDMHVHWYDEQYLPLFLANGVTGIRQMFGFPSLHQKWRQARIEGTLKSPRMYVASPIVDGPKPVWPSSVAVKGAEDGREAVRKAREDGADFVKVYSLLSREAYFAIADEARERGFPFAGHIPVTVTAREASDAGQASVEHLTGLLPACSSLEEDHHRAVAESLEDGQVTRSIFQVMRSRDLEYIGAYDEQKATDLFARFARNQTWQCPTLVVLRNIANLDDPAITEDPRARYLPSSIRRSWDPKNTPHAKSAESYEVARKVFATNLEIVGRMHQAGVPIIAGTDVLNPFCIPGFSLHDELELLVQAGLTPQAALQAATRNPALFMGREDLGAVETGKLADLVLLNADPLEHIGNTTKIAAVLMGGELFERDDLDAMLAAAKQAARPPLEPPERLRLALVKMPYTGSRNVAELSDVPDYLEAGGIADRLRKLHTRIPDGEIPTVRLTEQEEKEYGEWHRMGRANHHLAEFVATQARAKTFSVGLLANCTSLLGMVAGLQQGGPTQRPRRVGMVFIDAHGDINTPETTLSGMLGGMPVAVSAGLCLHNLRRTSGLDPALPPSYLVLACLRDLDPLEEELIERERVHKLTVEDIRTRSGELHAQMQRLSASTDVIYVHVDMDVLDPEEVPGHPLTVPGGPTSEELARAVQEMCRYPKVEAFGVASTPANERDPDGRSRRAAYRLIEGAVAGVQERR